MFQTCFHTPFSNLKRTLFLLPRPSLPPSFRSSFSCSSSSSSSSSSYSSYSSSTSSSSPPPSPPFTPRPPPPHPPPPPPLLAAIMSEQISQWLEHGPRGRGTVSRILWSKHLRWLQRVRVVTLFLEGPEIQKKQKFRRKLVGVSLLPGLRARV